MKYEREGFRTFRIDDEGVREELANFVAEITQEVRIVDGRTSETVLTIEGECPGEDPNEPIKLPPVEVEATAFAGMQWVLPNWGVRAVIRPGSGVKEDLRTCIQLLSKPAIRTIYRHLGWTTIDGKRAYLHAAGAITAKGNMPSVEVRLPPELSRYNLTATAEPKDAVSATLQLVTLTKPDVTWPLLAATLAPLYGDCDFGIHVAGRTGTFKSEIMSIFQSHYGAGMDARHLPGSWSSTANALEAQAYLCKNAAFVVDDFVPAGTAWQQRAYQQAADKLIRAAGNQAGRARLTDASNLQTTMYPRGIVLSTGEDVPEGHSVRARLLIMELSPGDVQPPKLTAAQKNRAKYPATVAALAQRLAETPIDLAETIESVRNKFIGIGHARTPSMLGYLVAVNWDFIDWALELGVISPRNQKAYRTAAEESIRAAGEKQMSFLEEVDPVDQFSATVRHIFGAGLAHVRARNGGIPLRPDALGWVPEKAAGAMDTWKSRGPCIGWVDWPDDELYLDMTLGLNVVKKAAGADMPLTKQTLLKRLKDGGLIARTDESRQRNTVRITADGHQRQVICLVLSQVLDTQEKPSNDSI